MKHALQMLAVALLLSGAACSDFTDSGGRTLRSRSEVETNWNRLAAEQQAQAPALAISIRARQRV